MTEKKQYFPQVKVGEFDRYNIDGATFAQVIDSLQNYARIRDLKPEELWLEVCCYENYGSSSVDFEVKRDMTEDEKAAHTLENQNREARAKAHRQAQYELLKKEFGNEG